jgi:O-antigen/teichoic acid export membrane protein
VSEVSIASRAIALLRGGRWRRIADRGFWTLTDRGLFAVTNFGVNLVLARWLSPESYGAYAIGFAIFLIIGAAQNSLVIKPLLVFGARRYEDRYRTYLGVVIKAQLALSVVLSVALALLGLGFILGVSRDIGTVLIALAVAGPFRLLLMLLRLSSYVHLQPRQAAGSGAVYMVLLLGCLYLLNGQGALTAETALLANGLTSLVVAVWLAVRQKAELLGEALFGSFGREVAMEHWRYGRWSVAAHVVSDGYRNLYLFVLPLWGGLEASGALSALMNLVMPISFFQQSLNVVTVPVLSRARRTGHYVEKTLLAAAFFVSTALVYCGLLFLFRGEIVNLLYVGRYDAYVDVLILVALLPIVRSLSFVFDASLSALERPKDIFKATIASAACAVTFGIAAVAMAGVAGAVVGHLLCAIVGLATEYWILRSCRFGGERT